MKNSVFAAGNALSMRSTLIAAFALLCPVVAGAEETPVSLPSSATAQVPTNEEVPLTVEVPRPGPAPGRMIKPERAVVADGTPFQMGSFLVFPQIDATWLYDDNLYSTKTATVSDHAVIYAPRLWVQSNWAKHAVNLQAEAESTRYVNANDENSDDYRLSAEGRFDFSADTNVYGGMRFAQEHEDRESPSTRNGLTPTKYVENRYYAGFFRQFERISLRLAGTAQYLDYDDVNFLTSGGAIQPINNDDRDRWQYTGGVRLGYEATPRLQCYLQVAYDNRRYDNATDDLGYQRDSDGRRYLAGLRWNLPRTAKFDAFVGRLTQSYTDARFANVSAPVAGAAVQWRVGERTSLSGSIDRTVEETTVSLTPSAGVTYVSSSYLNTYASVGVDHRLTDKLSARLNASLSRVAYQGISRTDEYQGLNLGFAYRAHRHLVLELNLAARKLDSSIPSEDFSKRTLSVRMVIPFSH